MSALSSPENDEEHIGGLAEHASAADEAPAKGGPQRRMRGAPVHPTKREEHTKTKLATIESKV
jgi:hypothetical protein